MNQWNAKTKPPAETCPKRFCVHWAEVGDKVTPVGHEFDSINESINAAVAVTSAKCACAFGLCKRGPDNSSNTDWYEPNDPALKKAGLPWFYFIAHLKNLGEQFHAQYTEESKALWGAHDGLSDL